MPEPINFNDLHTAWTHNGTFHADDTVSGAMLRSLNKDLKFIRSRNPASRYRADIAFDVGMGPFDHHGHRAGLDPNGIPWCGATRLWDAGLKDAIFPNDKKAQEIFYKEVLTPIALQDNGKPLAKEVPNLFSWVSHMNPRGKSKRTSDQAYEDSVDIAQRILPGLIEDAKAKLETQRILSKYPTNKDVLIIPPGLSDWQDYLRQNTSTKFVVYRGSKDTPWYAQCVPKAKGSRFSKRVPFPKDWRGSDPEVIDEAIGMPGAVFCHSGGFLSGYKSRAAALRACRKALEK